MTSLDQAFFKAFGQPHPSEMQPTKQAPKERELYTDLAPSASEAKPELLTIDSEPEPAMEAETLLQDEAGAELTWYRAETDFAFTSEPVAAVSQDDHAAIVIESGLLASNSTTASSGISGSETFLDDPLTTGDSAPKGTLGTAPHNENENENIIPDVSCPTDSGDKPIGKTAQSTVAPNIAAAPNIIVKPAWEVDAFRIPDPCIRLLDELPEALDEIRVRLQDVSHGEQKLINIHSWAPGEGRTTIAIALAQFLAEHGSRVLIIDADHQRPDLAECLGLSVEFGWETHIGGGESIEECCIYSVANEFTALPMVENDWEIGELSFGAKLRSVLDRALPTFDFILLDAAAGRPIWDNELADILAAQLIVRDARQTKDTEVLKLKRHLHQQSDQIVELIDNFSTNAQHHYKKTA